MHTPEHALSQLWLLAGRSGELKEQLTIFSGFSVHSHSLEEGAWHFSMSEVSEWGAEMARQVKALALSLITGTHVVNSRTHSHKFSDFHIHCSMDTHKLHKHMYSFLKLVM